MRIVSANVIGSGRLGMACLVAALCLPAAVLLTGCRGPAIAGPDEAAVTNGVAAVLAAGPGRREGVIGALLRPGIAVNVQVMVAGAKEVDEPRRRISDAGSITLPLIGTVNLAGRTVTEARLLLESLYGRYFVKPQVVLESTIDSGEGAVSPWGHVTVLGRVKNPGQVSIPPTRDLTVSRAIQLAGGLDSSARRNAILVTRTTDGESEQIKVSLDNIGARGSADNDIALLPGDVVFVPESVF